VGVLYLNIASIRVRSLEYVIQSTPFILFKDISWLKCFGQIRTNKAKILIKTSRPRTCLFLASTSAD